MQVHTGTNSGVGGSPLAILDLSNELEARICNAITEVYKHTPIIKMKEAVLRTPLGGLHKAIVILIRGKRWEVHLWIADPGAFQQRWKQPRKRALAEFLHFTSGEAWVPQVLAPMYYPPETIH